MSRGHVEADGVGEADVDTLVALRTDATVEATSRAVVDVVLAQRRLDLAKVRRLAGKRLPGEHGLFTAVTGLTAEYLLGKHLGQAQVEGIGLERLFLEPAVDHVGGASALADGSSDSRGTRDGVAAGEHVRHLGLQSLAVDLDRAAVAGRKGLAESRGVGTHADGDDDDVAVDGLAQRLVVARAESSRLVEHRSAFLEVDALNGIETQHGHDAPAVVHYDTLLERLVDLPAEGRHLLALLEANLLHRGGAQASRGAGRVHGDVAPADDHDALCLQVSALAELARLQERERRDDTDNVLALHAEPGGPGRTGRDEHCIETVLA